MEETVGRPIIPEKGHFGACGMPFKVRGPFEPIAIVDSLSGGKAIFRNAWAYPVPTRPVASSASCRPPLGNPHQNPHQRLQIDEEELPIPIEVGFGKVVRNSTCAHLDEQDSFSTDHHPIGQERLSGIDPCGML